MKSDLTELSYGSSGEPWLVVSAGLAELLRGPLVFRPEGVVAGKAGFSVQAAAFSQEEPARRSLEKLSTDFRTSGTVAFSAERGVYRVLLGTFATRAEAEALVTQIRSSGQDAIVSEGGGSPAPPSEGAAGAITLTSQEGAARRLRSPVEVFPPAPVMTGAPNVVVDGRPYRGSLLISLNPRGTLNLVNRVDLEEYLYGVVPAEMGPKRYDEIEALKAQAIAARTYAYAHRAQFEAEGYDLCATPKCQVYAGLSSEDPLSNGAVDATRGLVIASGGRFADALFVSTCGGRTENVENVFTGARPRTAGAASSGAGTFSSATRRVGGAGAPVGSRSRSAGPESRGRRRRRRRSRPRRSTRRSSPRSTSPLRARFISCRASSATTANRLRPPAVSPARLGTPMTSCCVSVSARASLCRRPTGLSRRRSTRACFFPAPCACSESPRPPGSFSRARDRTSGFARRRGESACPSIPTFRSLGALATAGSHLPP
jgi:hypothetical protein